MALYKGFSFQRAGNTGSFVITDVDLVKTDLLNHIFTRKGERIGLPNFGTLIPDIVFEPLDEMTIDQVKDELLEVIRYDPRVKLIDLITNPDYDSNTLHIEIRLFYIELNITEPFILNLQFEN
jgi:phage baseplate assembly protein W